MFSRSWEITKLSFRAIGKDKEMLLFPLFGGLFSLLYAVALLYPTILVQLLRDGSDRLNITLQVVDYALMGATYFGLAFIATFFNVCVVFTTKTRFEGGDATFMDSIKFACARIHLIFAWAMVAASVGLLLKFIDNAAQNSGSVGKIVLWILRAVLGALWSVLTIFVVPAMVFHGLGPIDAIKRSASTLKQTWGESLVRHYGLGFIQFLLFVVGIFATIGVSMALASLGGVGAVAAIAFGAIYFIGLILVFNVANAVYNTALYAYANGTTPPDFGQEALQGAFRTP